MILLDAGPLVALANVREHLHAWATAQLVPSRGPLFSCGAVLAESGFILQHHPLALRRLRALIERGTLRSIEESTVLWKRCFELMEQYSDLPMSFADACLVAAAEGSHGARIFTIDRDFLIYKGRGNRPLSLIAPFEH